MSPLQGKGGDTIFPSLQVEKAAEAKLLQVADDAEIRLRKSTRNKDELEGVIIDLGIQIKNQSDIIAEQLERIQTLSAQVFSTTCKSHSWLKLSSLLYFLKLQKRTRVLGICA